MMENLPTEPRREPEVIEPEIVGHEPPGPFWKRLLSRAALAGVMALFGLCLSAAGVILTMTIVGAVVGLPLIGLGLIVVVSSVWLFLGGGQVKIISGNIRGPR